MSATVTITPVDDALDEFIEWVTMRIPGDEDDVYILDNDPHDVDPDAIMNIQIVQTILGGRTVYEA